METRGLAPRQHAEPAEVELDLMQQYLMTVGNDGCDIRGFTNRHIQAAIDHVAHMGGGEVILSAGTYLLHDSVHLRSRVRVVGQGESTVLRKNAMVASKVTAFLGYGHDDIIVEQPDLFHLGDGIWIKDNLSDGFYTTVGTLIRREGDTWFTNRTHVHDYRDINDAVVYTLFPLVSAYDTEDASIENLSLDGNKAENPVTITGCRGGGVFALRNNRLTLRGLVVRGVNSEGIGFQACEHAEVADCLVENCTGNGFHPGSGTRFFHMHHCVSRNNDGCGLFYCLRVTDSVLEHCLFEKNGSHGISTGARNCDNANRNLTIRNNGGCGFFFRDDSYVNAAHRNSIEHSTFTLNCQKEGTAEVLIQGETDGTQLMRNTMTVARGITPVVTGPRVTGTVQADNTMIETD